jgi:acyl carrier protein
MPPSSCLTDLGVCRHCPAFPRHTLPQVWGAVEETLGPHAGYTRDRSDSGIDIHAPLMSVAGLDSLGAVELRGALERRLGMTLPPTLVFDYPSIAALMEYLQTRIPPSLSPDSTISPSHGSMGCGGAEHAGGDAAAVRCATAHTSAHCGVPHSIIGSPESTLLLKQPAVILALASRLPGHEQVYRSCLDAVGTVPLSWRWDADADWVQHLSRDGGSAPGMLAPRFLAALHGVAHFDAAAFNISGPEASLMDPQQRLLLEAAAEVLASATVGQQSSKQQRAYFASPAQAALFQDSPTGVSPAKEDAKGSSQPGRWKLDRLACGSFVGVSSQDYLKLAAMQRAAGAREQALQPRHGDCLAFQQLGRDSTEPAVSGYSATGECV